MNKIALEKIGGHSLSEKDLENPICSIKHLLKKGYRVVICHGGTPGVEQALKKNNIPSIFRDGLRVTSEEAMNVVQESVLGIEVPGIVRKINSALVRVGEKPRAVSVSGIDAFCIRCHKKMDDDGTDYGFVGEIDDIGCAFISALLDAGYIPVISPIGADETGQIFNLNSDHVAGKAAVALNAELFLMVTNVNGVFENVNDENTRIPFMNAADYDRYRSEGKILPSMATKLDAMFEYVRCCHRPAYLLPHDQKLCYEVFADDRIGTKLIDDGGYIRSAFKEDVPAIIDLDRSSFPKYQENIGADYMIKPLRETESDVQRDILHDQVLLYQEGKDIIGQIRIHIEDSRARAYRLCVDPKHQNRNIGSRLLQKAEEIVCAEGIPALGLTSLINVDYLDRFYQRNGYELIDTDSSRGYQRSVYIKHLSKGTQFSNREWADWLLNRKETL